MEIFLWLSGISFLVTIFTILLFIISIPLVLVFKGAGNEKPIFTIAGIVSLIILQTTINSYINILNPYKYLGIVCLGLFFIVFLIPFVKYAFPDLSFPGRSFLGSGIISIVLCILNINTIQLDISNFLNIKIVLYVSVLWSLWFLAAFILNPIRRSIVFNIVFFNKTKSFDPQNLDKLN